MLNKLLRFSLFSFLAIASYVGSVEAATNRGSTFNYAKFSVAAEGAFDYIRKQADYVSTVKVHADRRKAAIAAYRNFFENHGHVIAEIPAFGDWFARNPRYEGASATKKTITNMTYLMTRMKTSHYQSIADRAVHLLKDPKATQKMRDDARSALRKEMNTLLSQIQKYGDKSGGWSRSSLNMIVLALIADAQNIGILYDRWLTANSGNRDKKFETDMNTAIYMAFKRAF